MDESSLYVEAALHAAELVRVAQRLAFAQRGRSMVASDMLNSLKDAVESEWPTGI